MVPMMSHHRVPCTGPTHEAFLRPTKSWLLRTCILHVSAVAEAVLRTCGAAENVASGPTISAVRRDYWDKSVFFFHLADPTVAMGIHDCCGGGGKNCKDKLPRRPLVRSDGGNEDNSRNVPLRYLRRDPVDSGPPTPHCSSENKTTLNEMY